MSMSSMRQEPPALADPLQTSPGIKEASLPPENTAAMNRRNSEKSTPDHDATLPNGLKQQEDDPEGGPLGVRAIIGAWGVYFCCWGFVGSWSVFQNRYRIDELREHTPSEIAWIGSIQLCMVYFSTVFAGRLYDSGYLRLIILVSGMFSTVGFMLASISTQYWHYILTQGLLVGIGLGSGFAPVVACVSSYYRKQRGLANGLLSSGSAIGGLVIPIYLSKMIDNPKIGLGWALRTSGFVCLLFFGIAYLIMKQKKTIPNKKPLLDFSVFKQTAYCYLAAGYFMTTLGIFYPIFYIQPYAISQGVDPNLAFYSIAILNGVSLIGRVFPLMISDKIGAMNVMVVTLVIASILIFGFAGVHNFGGVAAFSALNGIAYGCYVTLNPLVTANLSDHPSRIGTHIGLAFLCTAMAAIAGPPALGAVITATGQYWQGAVIAGAFVAIGVCFVAVATYFNRKNKGTWRV